MELSLEAIIGIVSLLLGGSGLTAIITWRYVRKKAKAEASLAEAEAERAKFESVQAAVNATKEVQDSYQQLLSDMKSDREEQRAYVEEQKQYIAELKEDRRHLRAERDELRERQDKLERTMRDLQDKVARQGRMYEATRPLLCGRRSCIDRIPVAPSVGEETDATSQPVSENPPATVAKADQPEAQPAEARQTAKKRVTRKPKVNEIDPYNGD